MQTQVKNEWCSSLRLWVCVSDTQGRPPVVLELLQREDVLVEILLKFFVGIVDVKLFKPVHLQDTEYEGRKISSAALKHQQIMKKSGSQLHFWPPAIKPICQRVKKKKNFNSVQKWLIRGRFNFFTNKAAEHKLTLGGEWRKRLLITSKFSKPKMSRIPMDLKFSFPLILWLIFMMIQEKHWE